MDGAKLIWQVNEVAFIDDREMIQPHGAFIILDEQERITGHFSKYVSRFSKSHAVTIEKDMLPPRSTGAHQALGYSRSQP